MLSRSEGVQPKGCDRVEYLAIPLILLVIVLGVWIRDEGPQEIFREIRKAAEANARAEEARLEQKRLDRDRERS